MRPLPFIFLVIGVGLLALLVATADLAAVRDHIVELGPGFGLVLLIYAGAFLLDVWAWQLALSGAWGALWTWRLAWVRMVGEAVNNVTPLATIGGEPVKAIILNRRYRVTYGEGVASLVITKTVILLALLAFLGLGLILIAATRSFTPWVHGVAFAGFAGLVVGVGGLFAIQHVPVTSGLVARLSRRRSGERIARLLNQIRIVENTMASFYRHNPVRFALATALAFVNWILGALELYVILWLLGHPITFAEAWIVETLVQVVRLGLFLIPAGIGAQEGALVLALHQAIGVPGLGLAVAFIRRGRELVWIGLGLLLWLALARGVRPRAVGETGPSG